MSGDKLYGDGLNIYNDCWASIQEHWSDFDTSSDEKNEEWIALLNNLKKEVTEFRIKEMRRNIEALWDQCYICEMQRKQSIINNKDVNLEVSLLKHKEELLSMRDYLSKNKELIDLMKKYEDFLKIVDSREESPDERLKKNRGAVLLKQEQRRKLLLQVPKLQKSILKHIKEKELEGFTFLIRGEHFEDIMERNNKKYFVRKSLSVSQGNVSPPVSSQLRRFSADVKKFKNTSVPSEDKVQRSTSMKL